MLDFLTQLQRIVHFNKNFEYHQVLLFDELKSVCAEEKLLSYHAFSFDPQKDGITYNSIDSIDYRNVLRTHSEWNFSRNLTIREISINSCIMRGQLRFVVIHKTGFELGAIAASIYEYIVMARENSVISPAECRPLFGILAGMPVSKAIKYYGDSSNYCRCRNCTI